MAGNRKFVKVETHEKCAQRAPDLWESARFQAVSLAQGWFRKSGVIFSRPPAGLSPIGDTANRWMAPKSDFLQTIPDVIGYG